MVGAKICVGPLKTLPGEALSDVPVSGGFVAACGWAVPWGLPGDEAHDVVSNIVSDTVAASTPFMTFI